MELTDGKQNMYALEVQMIHDLQGYTGEKIIIRDAPVVRGLVLLSDSNVLCLGGQLSSNFESESHMLDPPNIENVQRIDIDLVQIKEHHKNDPLKSTIEINNSIVKQSDMNNDIDFNSSNLINLTASTDKSFQVSIPKELSLFKQIKDIKLNETAKVKACILTVIDKLKNNDQEYLLTIEISDGLSNCIAKVDSMYIQNHLFYGINPEELNALKMKDKSKYHQILSSVSSTLPYTFEGIFQITKVLHPIWTHYIHIIFFLQDDFCTFLLNQCLSSYVISYK